MRKLPIPVDRKGKELDATEILKACTSNMVDLTLKTHLENCSTIINTAINDYKQKAKKNLLHTIATATMVGAHVKAKEMENVYTNKMARAGQGGRPYYDLILSAPKFGRCPLCAQRTASTLDHYLPKTSFPVYAIVPINLIPACFDCNKIKTAMVATKAEEETLHPYFDDIENDLWLFAKVNVTSPVSISFYVTAPASWSSTLAQRVQYHFDTLKLNKLYVSHAAEELTNIKAALQNLHRRGGPRAVRDHLTETANSCQAAYANSWQTAFYKSLSASHWFHTTGVLI